MEPQLYQAQPLESAGAEKQGGLSASTLKYIAIAAMLIDHVAAGFLPDGYSTPLGVVMHFIGRITGPTMFFFIAEGYHHTRNANRYTLRLGLFAIISYLPFVWFATGSPLPGSLDDALALNVIYTLFLGLLCLRARHEIANPVLRWVLIGVMMILSGFGDWGFIGIACIMMFDAFRGDFNKQAFGYCIITLMQIMPALTSVSLVSLSGSMPADQLLSYVAYITIMCGMFLPIILLKFYNGRPGGSKASKWVFYIFYPAHLLLICAVRDWLLPML